MRKIGRRQRAQIGAFVDVSRKELIVAEPALDAEAINGRLLRLLYRGIPVRWYPMGEMAIVRTAEMPLLQLDQTRYAAVGEVEVAYIGRRR